jgi:hypothetical protein
MELLFYGPLETPLPPCPVSSSRQTAASGRGPPPRALVGTAGSHTALRHRHPNPVRSAPVPCPRLGLLTPGDLFGGPAALLLAMRAMLPLHHTPKDNDEDISPWRAAPGTSFRQGRSIMRAAHAECDYPAYQHPRPSERMPMAPCRVFVVGSACSGVDACDFRARRLVGRGPREVLSRLLQLRQESDYSLAVACFRRWAVHIQRGSCEAGACGGLQSATALSYGDVSVSPLEEEASHPLEFGELPSTRHLRMMQDDLSPAAAFEPDGEESPTGRRAARGERIFGPLAGLPTPDDATLFLGASSRRSERTLSPTGSDVASLCFDTAEYSGGLLDDRARLPRRMRVRFLHADL